MRLHLARALHRLIRGAVRGILFPFAAAYRAVWENEQRVRRDLELWEGELREDDSEGRAQG